MANHKLDLSSMPNNSDAARNEKQKQEQKAKEIVPVVSGNVTRRKQSVGRKFADTFFTESLETVKDYVIEDVVMPNIKDTFLDIVFQGLSMWLTGDAKAGRRRGSGSSKSSGGYSPGRVSYQSYYDDPKPQTRGSYTRRRDTYNFEDIILPSKGEAEKVIDRMIDILEQYEVVSVGDLYQLIGLSTENTDFKYGWTNLESASTKRVNGGYLLDLPRAKVI